MNVWRTLWRICILMLGCKCMLPYVEHVGFWFPDELFQDSSLFPALLYIYKKKITFNYFIGLNSLGPSTLLERARVHSCRWQLGIKFDCCTDNNQMCLGLPCGGGGGCCCCWCFKLLIGTIIAYNSLWADHDCGTTRFELVIGAPHN